MMCVCVYVWVHIFVCEIVEVRGGYWVSLSVALHLRYRGRVSHLHLELTDLASLVSQLALGSSISASQMLGLQWATMPTWYFHRGWGSKLGSSCSCSKQFTH